MTGIDVKPYRVVVFECEYSDSIDYYCADSECRLSFNPVSGRDEENKLFMQENLRDFITVNSSNDTLRLRLRLNDLCRKYNENLRSYAIISNINLRLHTSDIDIINNVRGMTIEIKDIETDSIKIDVRSNVNIYSCTANVINHLRSTGFVMKGSEVKELNLDLDNVHAWSVENSKIKEENLTGSNKHNVQQGRNESRRVNWFPKRKEAELHVTLSDTAQIIFP
jgi:hypothetical protein